MNELFATTADVYRLTGELDPGARPAPERRQRRRRTCRDAPPPGPHDRPRRARCATRRLARVRARLARPCRSTNSRGQLRRVIDAHGCRDATRVVSAGCGDFLVADMCCAGARAGVPALRPRGRAHRGRRRAERRDGCALGPSVRAVASRWPRCSTGSNADVGRQARRQPVPPTRHCRSGWRCWPSSAAAGSSWSAAAAPSPTRCGARTALWQFDDLPAHNMAVLAMAQTGYQLPGDEPDAAAGRAPGRHRQRAAQGPRGDLAAVRAAARRSPTREPTGARAPTRSRSIWRAN